MSYSESIKRAQAKYWRSEKGRANALRRKMSPQRKVYEKAYYQAHKDQYQKRYSKWAQSHRERMVGFVLKSRAKNPQPYKDYTKSYGVKYRLQHREKLNEKNRRYSKQHYRDNKERYFAKAAQRRALEKASCKNLEAIVAFRESVKSKPVATCYWCEKEISTKLVHFDHIVPLSKGGPHSVENLCVSCPECNRRKGAKTIKQWLQFGQQFLNI